MIESSVVDFQEEDYLCLLFVKILQQLEEIDVSSKGSSDPDHR